MREADGQMRIAAVRGHEQGMTLGIMQQHERTTALDFPTPAD